MRKSRYVTFEINLKSQSQLSRDQLVPQCCGKDARHSRIALADSGERVQGEKKPFLGVVTFLLSALRSTGQ